MTIFVLEEQNQKLLFASEEEAQRSKIVAAREYQDLGWSHYYGEVRKFNSSLDSFQEDNYEDGINKNVPLEFGNEGAKKCKRIARKIHAWWNERDNHWDKRYVKSC